MIVEQNNSCVRFGVLAVCFERVGFASEIDEAKPRCGKADTLDANK